MVVKDYSYPRLPDDEYYKIVGQFMMLINVGLEPLKMYGQKDYVEKQLSPAIKKAFEDALMRVRGKNQPIQFPSDFNPQFYNYNDID